MTTPETFRANLLAGLTALNAKVPAGSKVILWGLADGSILWNNTYNLLHPIGNGVTYAQFYKFLTFNSFIRAAVNHKVRQIQFSEQR